jgi:hypothetical protein
MVGEGGTVDQQRVLPHPGGPLPTQGLDLPCALALQAGLGEAQTPRAPLLGQLLPSIQPRVGPTRQAELHRTLTSRGFALFPNTDELTEIWGGKGSHSKLHLFNADAGRPRARQFTGDKL